MADEIAGVPMIVTVRSRVRLSTLQLTKPGDVFYLAVAPWCVYLRSFDDQEHDFQTADGECWLTAADIGSPGARVVVLHNVLKPWTHDSETC